MQVVRRTRRGPLATISLALTIALVCFLVGLYAARMLQGRVVDKEPHIEQAIEDGTGS